MLHQDTSVLLKDSEPIQKLYRQIRNPLAPDLVAMLTPAVFIESNFLQVHAAQKRIADRQDNQQAMPQLEACRQRVKVLK